MKPQMFTNFLLTVLSKSTLLLLAVSMLFGVAKAQETAPKDPQDTTEAIPKVSIVVDNDGIVPLSGLHKWATPIKCRIKLTSTQDDDITVVLVSKVFASKVPNTRLSFQTLGAGEVVNPDGTLTIVLPKDGTSKDFSISGIYRSDRYGDALIEAHYNSVSGDTVGSALATVYWFTLKHMFAVKGPGIYSITIENGSSTLSANPIPAIRTNAQALLQPGGVSVPILKLGVIQNALAPNTVTEIWGNPEWVNPIAGDNVTIYSQYQVTTDLAVDAYDAIEFNFTQPKKIQNSSIFVSLDNGGGIAPSADTPGVISDLTKTINVMTNKGVLTEIKYTLLTLQTLDEDFLDWSTLLNTTLPQNDKTELQSATQTMLQASWSLHVGTGRTLKTVTINAVDQSPTQTPVLTTDKMEFANWAQIDSPSGLGPLVTISGPTP